MIDLLPIHIDQRTGLLVVEHRTPIFGPLVRVRQYYVDETMGDSSRQAYFEVDADIARGLPELATRRA